MISSLIHPVYLRDSGGREIPNFLSAFGEHITAELSPIFQYSFEATISNTELIAQTVSGTGACSNPSAMAQVATGATAGSKAWLRGQHAAKYNAGFGALLRISFMAVSPAAGCTQAAVLVDEYGSTSLFKNGLAVGMDGIVPTLYRFQNDTTYKVARSAWDDPLDGTGRSGINLDFTKLNVFYIQYKYLGAGAINFYCENPSNGLPYLFHQIPYANLYTIPSSFNPNYYAGIFVTNGATTSNVTANTASIAYFIEGKTAQKWMNHLLHSTPRVSKSGVTADVPMLTIRNKATYNSKKNFIDLRPVRYTISSEASSASNQAWLTVIKNATLTGASYSDIHATNSVVEVDTSATVVSGGIISFPTELAGKNGAAIEDINDFFDILHPNESLTFVVGSTNSCTFKASLQWKELF